MENLNINVDLLEKKVEEAKKQFNSDTGLNSETHEHFPLDIFPSVVQDIINNAWDVKGMRKDFHAAGVLSAVATAIGRSLYLKQPIDAPATLWIAIVGGSGRGKTHPLKLAFKRIKELDAIRYEEYSDNLNEWKQNGQEGDKPIYPKLRLNDFTPEKMATNLKVNDKGVVVFRDELMGWIESMSRYNASGEQEKALELFNADELSVERKGEESLLVDRPIVNVIGGIQPSKLHKILGGGRETDGFISRMLFVFPDIGEFKAFSLESIDSQVQGRFDRLIDSIYHRSPSELSVSVEAASIVGTLSKQLMILVTRQGKL